MRLLLVGDTAATGFGTVTLDLGRNLLDLEWDVRFMSMNVGGQLPPEPFGSRTYDVEPDERPEAVLTMMTGNENWKPDAIVMISDFYSTDWVIQPGFDPKVVEALRAIPTFHYCPIEGLGTPLAWKRLWDIAKPIAISKFGQAEMARVMGYEPPMVYHGVDQEVFFPLAPNRPARHLNDAGGRATNKAAAKAEFGLDPNRVHILRADRHMPRKRYNSMIRSLYPVFAKHPDVDMVIHCKPWDFGGRLDEYLLNYPEWFHQRFKFTMGHNTYQGYSREQLNVLYNAADLYVSTGAEGFGLTIAEAIACGVPVVGMDYSAVPEVIGPAGVTVPPAYLFDNEYNYFWAGIDEPAFAAAVDRLLSKPALRRSLGAQGPKHVAANFNWRRSAEQFVTLITEATQAVAA